MAMLIVLALGSACVFYGYVLRHLWREMTARPVHYRTAEAIVALPQSTAIQLKLDRDRGVRSLAARPQFAVLPGAVPRAPLRREKAPILKWPGTKDAA